MECNSTPSSLDCAPYKRTYHNTICVSLLQLPDHIYIYISTLFRCYFYWTGTISEGKSFDPGFVVIGETTESLLPLQPHEAMNQHLKLSKL